jgi:hypothetical protein
MAPAAAPLFARGQRASHSVVVARATRPPQLSGQPRPQGRQRSDGRDGRLFVHRRRRARIQLWAATAPHNGLELSCPADAGRPRLLYGTPAG